MLTAAGNSGVGEPDALMRAGGRRRRVCDVRDDMSQVSQTFRTRVADADTFRPKNGAFPLPARLWMVRDRV